ncbi:hypothetical protein HDV00_002606 [Rhizophlyctis rosea]|nr:hypothetical protein HDV00_002606 [Rhizophlyctis rosea]
MYQQQQYQQYQQYQQQPSQPSPITDPNLERFRNLVQQHEISLPMARKLRALEAFDIVVIADDSGSMTSPCTVPGQDPFAPRITRWDELKSVIKTVVDIGTTLDDDGIDLYFLNRPHIHNVTSADQVARAFANPPHGYTPIARTLRQVLRDKAGLGVGENTKKLLIVIATDGEPTDEVGTVDKATLYNVLMYERRPIQNIHVAFVACTDDDATMAYLNEWDNIIQNLDVVDDYYSERSEILRVQGPSFPFSRGDWVCKILLGSIDPEIDALDEVPGVFSGGGTIRRGSSNTAYRQHSRASLHSNRADRGGSCVIS